MATHNTYQVTVCLTVTDAPALRQAAAQLAKALGLAGWKSARTEDDLIMMLDPGPLPGAEVIEMPRVQEILTWQAAVGLMHGMRPRARH